MSGYTVLDLETSGYSPGHDRVVEVALVHVADDGVIQEHWYTLVDPSTAVGPTHVHGITATDVQDAPGFAAIAPQLIAEWAGTTLVAHNVPSTLGFLTEEFQRAGLALNDLPLQAVSTMEWASHFLDTPSRRLADCCASAGITLTSTHTAIGNALATAELLRFYLCASNGEPPWQDQLESTRSYNWPETEPAGTIRTAERSSPLPRRQGRWLDEMVTKLPRTAHGGADSYLSALEEAMLDHKLSRDERDALAGIADRAGFSRDTIEDLHRAYLQALAATAAADGVVGVTERGVLEQVAHSLGLSGDDVATALAAADDEASTPDVSALADYNPTRE